MFHDVKTDLSIHGLRKIYIIACIRRELLLKYYWACHYLRWNFLKDSFLDWNFLKDSNFNLNALTILAKCSIWGAWLLGPACAPTGGYSTTLKIQADVFLWQQVQSKYRWNQFEVLVSQLSKHKPTSKTTIKSICVVSLSRIFVRQFFCKLYQRICVRFYIY